MHQRVVDATKVETKRSSSEHH